MVFHFSACSICWFLPLRVSASFLTQTSQTVPLLSKARREARAIHFRSNFVATEIMFFFFPRIALLRVRHFQTKCGCNDLILGICSTTFFNRISINSVLFQLIIATLIRYDTLVAVNMAKQVVIAKEMLSSHPGQSIEQRRWHTSLKTSITIKIFYCTRKPHRFSLAKQNYTKKLQIRRMEFCCIYATVVQWDTTAHCCTCAMWDVNKIFHLIKSLKNKTLHANQIRGTFVLFWSNLSFMSGTLN